MPSPLALPDGYLQRALTLDDAQAITDVIAADERANTGEVSIELADIVADWSRPSSDLGNRAVGVEYDGRLVAYVEAMGGFRGDANVHPDHWGRGIGTELARWLRDMAAELGLDVIGMPRLVGSPAEQVLADLGWFVRWTSWVLELPEGAEIPRRALPQGYAIRQGTPDDYRAIWTVQEDAFLEWADRERESFEDWLAEGPQRLGFEPWNFRVVCDPSGAIVAMAYVFIAQADEGYVDSLATRSDQRGRGLAQALLADAFAAARTHGASRSALNTDSRTGALDLYRKVGMEVTKTYHHRATPTAPQAS